MAKFKSVPREFMQVIQPHVDQKVIEIVVGGKHTCVKRRDGHKMAVPGSPSDHRALLNFRSQLRRFISAPAGIMQ